MKHPYFHTENLKKIDMDVAFSKRSKNMRITINSIGQVKVIVPFGVAKEQIKALIVNKEKWILDTLEKVQHNQIKTSLPNLYTETTTFTTRNHKLQIAKAHIANARIEIRNGVINVQYPMGENISNPLLQDFIKKGIVEALRIEAHQYLPKRLAQLALQHKFTYSGVSIKNIKSRWGSCSHTNNINLNVHLMRLPDKLIDYVLVHELAHTVVKNHSSQFWSLLAQKLPDALVLDKEINKYSTLL
ncbi:MAG: M48 family metallopeptidase [Sphingobacteriales bacterium]|nr:MAG: M48 family metallopeptidase [Sphingobacteriales bacterium]